MMVQASQLEEDLLIRIRQGDDRAFDRLLELYTPRVYRLAYRMVGHAEDAQDLTQEAFLRVFDALPHFRGDAAFSTWLYRIVVNVCYDELKRRRRRPPPLSDLEDTEEGFTLRDTATTGETAEDAVLQRERSEAVQRAIAELPEAFRTVLVLYDLQGLSYQEIADVLKQNIGTVKSRLNRARNLLREKIAAERELFGVPFSRNI